MSIEILLQNINFSFIKGKKNVDVLENISFEVAEKEFVSIVGPSGCGKTTLLKIISGLYNSSPTYHLKGKILVKGKMPSQCRQQNEFGFVFQNPVLLAWKTVLKNIELPIRILQAKMPTQNFWQPEELLDMVGLKDFKNAYPFELSGGMQQRVALAMALVFKPSILLLDEPFEH